jgi:hypothetical protein
MDRHVLWTNEDFVEKTSLNLVTILIPLALKDKDHLQSFQQLTVRFRTKLSPPPHLFLLQRRAPAVEMSYST